MSFADVRTVLVPRQVVMDSHDHLQSVGRQRLEAFALWAGQHVDGKTFHVRHAIIPVQKNLRFDDGVCVTVDGAELHRINRWLFDNRMTLVAQLHTHPTDAYHSDTDDRFPIVTTFGGLSLVVPNFAQDSFSLVRCAVFRLLPPEGWVELTEAETAALIRIAH